MDNTRHLNLKISDFFVVYCSDSALNFFLNTSANNQNRSISPSVEEKEPLFSYFLLCALQSRMPQIVKFLAVDENVK